MSAIVLFHQSVVACCSFPRSSRCFSTDGYETEPVDSIHDREVIPRAELHKRSDDQRRSRLLLHNLRGSRALSVQVFVVHDLLSDATCAIWISDEITHAVVHAFINKMYKIHVDYTRATSSPLC